MQDLLALGREKDHQKRVAELSDALARMQRRMARISGFEQAMSDLGTNLAVWTILLLAIPLVHDTTY